MTVNRGPGVAKNGSVGVTTLEHRLQLAGQYAENAPGVPRSGVLAQATSVLVSARPDMSYDIGPASLVISRTASEGVYTPTLTGTTNVPTDDAPASNSRWDLVYVKQNDIAKGDADNLAVVGVVKGTAAATPTKPTGSLPAGAMVLAEARIFAGTTGTNGGSNTVSQVWRHTAVRGAPIPVRNDTERAEITVPAPYQTCPRLDVPGVIDVWDGAAWSPAPSSLILGHMGKTDGNQAISGTTAVAFSAAQILRGGVTFSDAQESLIVPRTGLYRVSVGARFTGSGTGICVGEVWKNANVPTGVQVRGYKDAAGEPFPAVTETIPLNAGDNLFVVVYGPAQYVYGANGYNGTFLEIEYAGQ